MKDYVKPELEVLEVELEGQLCDSPIPGASIDPDKVVEECD